jgi:hypothetical protein
MAETIKDSFQKMNGELQDLTIPKIEESNRYYELTKRSLEEVKHLTEYEDEKANRILTAIAFLSALAGAIFVALVPKNKNAALLSYNDWNWSVWFYYVSFAIFLILLAYGTILVVHALKPRFNIPRVWRKEPNSNSNQDDPDSFLFFEQILKVGPEKWAKSFCKKNSDQLEESYIKCNITETYLVSEKIRTKLKYLQPGIFILWLAVICLLIWFLFCGLRIAFPPKAI